MECFILKIDQMPFRCPTFCLLDLPGFNAPIFIDQKSAVIGSFQSFTHVYAVNTPKVDGEAEDKL